MSTFENTSINMIIISLSDINEVTGFQTMNINPAKMIFFYVSLYPAGMQVDATCQSAACINSCIESLSTDEYFQVVHIISVINK